MSPLAGEKECKEYWSSQDIRDGLKKVSSVYFIVTVRIMYGGKEESG